MSQHPANRVNHVQIAPPPSNGLGVAGFVCGILGLLTCGILAPLGLLFSLVGLIKRPRGLAIAGFIISIVALIPPALVVLVIGGGTVLATVGLGAFANMIEAEAAAQQIHASYLSTGSLPTQAEGDQVLAGYTPIMGNTPRYTPTGATTFDLTLPGKDKQWGTADDYVKTFDVTQMTSINTP